MDADVKPVRRLGSEVLRGLLSAAGLLLGLALAASAPAAAQEVVALVHPSNPAQSISVKQLRLLYGSYKRTWESGTPVHLLLPPPGDDGMKFLVSTVFRKQSEEDISRYYLQAIFEQKIASAPPQLSRSEALGAVRRDPGAIVLLDAASVGDATGVRMLRIED